MSELAIVESRRDAIDVAANPWDTARRQLDTVAERNGLDAGVHARLRQPKHGYPACC